MNWIKAAQSTYIGIESYKARTTRRDWTVIDTLKLVSSMQTALASLAWQESQRQANGVVQDEELANTTMLWYRRS